MDTAVFDILADRSLVGCVVGSTELRKNRSATAKYSGLILYLAYVATIVNF
jgi:hypothetical protein